MSSDQGFGADRHDLGCRVVQQSELPSVAGRALQVLGRVLRRGERETAAGRDSTALARIAGAPRGSAGARS